MKTLKVLGLAMALGVPGWVTMTHGFASAGLALPDDRTPAQQGVPPGADTAAPDSDCPGSSLDVYFRAFDSEVSAEATAALMGIALAYRACDVEQIVISSRAVESASPDSTPDIAAERGENLAGLMRIFFLGRADVVVRVEQAEERFGPEARSAKVKLVT